MRIKLQDAWLLALACFLWLGQTVTHAAIGIGPAGTLLTFDTVPSADEFATAAMAGGADTYLTLEHIDALVAATDAKRITNGLTSTSTTPPSTSGIGFRYHTNWQVLQSRPAGVASVMMKATLRNETGNHVGALVIDYDLAMQSPTATIGELPGHIVYWSLTGASNSWTRIDSLSRNYTPGRLNGILPLGNWPPNAELYLLWVDDNAQSMTDPSYTLDNMRFTIDEQYSPGISVPAGGTSVLTFDSMPKNTEWYTFSAPGLSTEIQTAAELDAQAQLLEAASVNQILGISTNVPASASSNVTWSSALHTLVTRPVDCSFQALMSTFRNDTGSNVELVNISYSLANLASGATNRVGIVGLRVFFSLTGASNSWQLIPEFSMGTTGTLTATLPVGAWLPNKKLFVLWVNDNSNTENQTTGRDEGAYMIDDVQVTPPVELRITRLDSTMLEVAWPYPSVGFQLQSKESLAGDWASATVFDNPGGGWHRVHFYYNGVGPRFFRLAK